MSLRTAPPLQGHACARRAHDGPLRVYWSLNSCRFMLATELRLPSVVQPPGGCRRVAGAAGGGVACGLSLRWDAGWMGGTIDFGAVLQGHTWGRDGSFGCAPRPPFVPPASGCGAGPEQRSQRRALSARVLGAWWGGGTGPFSSCWQDGTVVAVLPSPAAVAAQATHERAARRPC
jgi:hypothetical protein